MFHPLYPSDLDTLERLAMAGTAGGRTCIPHPTRNGEHIMLDDDGAMIATGDAPDIELAAACSPDVVLQLVRLARQAMPQQQKEAA